MTQNSVSEYLRKIEQRLVEEQEKSESYLPKKYTRDLLMKTVEYELIGRYDATLIANKQSGCESMFNLNKIGDLKRMYRLFSRCDLKNSKLQKSMYEYIRARGESIVCDVENLSNPQKFVSLVLALRAQFQTIVTDAFCNDKNFARKLKEAFEFFINLDVRSAQYLSLFTDSLLRKHANKMSENEVLGKLENVMTIFKYLSDKDIFEDFYKQHLAQRLLHTKSHSDHFEKAMIAKLKSECGHQYTSKLEGMFNDIDKSREIMEQWNMIFKNDETQNDTHLNAKVLTTGYWPLPSRKGVAAHFLPPHLQKLCDKFRSFYCDQHSGRKLIFDSSRGSAELRVEFDAAPKDLVVHTYQMCILLLFNDKDCYSWQEICAKLKIDSAAEREEWERHILALAHPKVRVLHKKPNKKILLMADTFSFNRKYKNQRVRVNIGILDNSAANRRAKMLQIAEKPKVPQQVLESRKNRVEAAIVRIMKARKKLHHQQLIVEVVHQLQARFNPDPQFIKQRIAALIEREYLERDAKDRRLYHYLA